MVEWQTEQVIAGEYAIEKELGRGGMGRVWLVKSRSTGRLFAVKQALIRDDKHRKAFLSELQTWIDLPEHPNIVPCRFFRTVGDEIVIFADYIDGGSLAEWITKGKLNTLEQILDVAIQFAWGLHAIHERGLIHQDVKPGNVLMTSEGVPMVADFGLARARLREDDGSFVSPSLPPGEESALVSVGGMTPAYASPEQCAGRPLSRKTDVWSWGVSLLDMFMGGVSCPHGGHIALEVLEAFIEDGQQDGELPRLPEDLAHLLRKCFNPLPETRFLDFGQVIEVLGGVYERSCGTERRSLRSAPATVQTSQEQHSLSVRYARTPEEWLQYAHQIAGISGAPPQAKAISEQGSLVRGIAMVSEACRLLGDLLVQGRTDIADHFADASWVHADLHRRLGDWSGCLGVWEQTAHLLSHVSQDDTGVQPLLADAYYWQAQALVDSGRNQAATRSCEVAMGILASLPQVPKHLVRLAKTYQVHARSLSAQGLLDQAQTSFSAAVRILDEHNEQCPHDVGAQRSLSLACHNWAALEKSRPNGDIDGALDLYRQAVQIREAILSTCPEDDLIRSLLAGSYSNMAGLLADRGDSDAALAAAEKAVVLRERVAEGGAGADLDEGLARAYFNKAGQLFLASRYEEAVEVYAQAFAAFLQLAYFGGRTELAGLLQHARANTDSALNEIEKENPTAADRVYAKHVERFRQLAAKDSGGVLVPQVATMISNWAGVKDLLGEGQKAIALLREAVTMLERMDPSRLSDDWCRALAMTYLNLGSALFREGEIGAERCMEKARGWSLNAGALQKGPPLLLYFGRACAALARQAAFSGRSEQARGYLSEVTGAVDAWQGNDRSGLETVLTAAGDVFRALGEHREAVACYDKALDISPHQSGALVNKANTLDDMGQHDEALNCYDQALAIDSQNATAWGNKGVALNAMGEHQTAIECFDKALAITPRHVIAWFSKGNALSALGQREDAIQCFNDALAIDPEYAGACFNKACAEDESGQADVAVRSYRRFLEVASPHDARQVTYAQERMRVLSNQQSGRGHPEAHGESHDADALPESGEVLNRRIQALLDDGQMDEAVAVSEKLQTIPGWEVVGACKQAQIFAAQGAGMAGYLVLKKWTSRYERSAALWFTMAVILRPSTPHRQHALQAAKNALMCYNENPKQLSPDNYRYLEQMAKELSGKP